MKSITHNGKENYLNRMRVDLDKNTFFSEFKMKKQTKEKYYEILLTGFADVVSFSQAWYQTPLIYI